MAGFASYVAALTLFRAAAELMSRLQGVIEGKPYAAEPAPTAGGLRSGRMLERRRSAVASRPETSVPLLSLTAHVLRLPEDIYTASDLCQTVLGSC